MTQYCQFTDPPSGAGTRVWVVWAHRSSPAAIDWATIGPTEASRVPPCTSANGLFTRVPRDVVRDLRRSCVDPGQLTAKACGRGRVASITLRAPWALGADVEDDQHNNAEVRIGDDIVLASALDHRLKALPADGRLRLPMPRIGTAEVTVHVVTKGGRISAIKIKVRQRR